VDFKLQGPARCRAIRARIQEIAETRVRYGIARIQMLLRRELKGEDVVRVMERIKIVRGLLPKRIKVDNGSEFISKALDKWAYENNVILDFSRPGKPTDNAFIESFNGSFRDECLNVNWFLSRRRKG
jgi:transposase InsO family protein